LAGLTVKEGVFSEWKGQQALKLAPDLLQRHIAFDHIDDVDAGKQFLDEAFGDHRSDYAPLSWNQVLP
jgi:hypothetical protein